MKSIGIEISGLKVRAVTAASVKGITELVGERQVTVREHNEIAGALIELIGEMRIGDRTAACLDAVGTFYRRLSFPFAEPKKIEAAIGLEMSSQLPISDELICDFLDPVAGKADIQVETVAVKRSRVSEVVRLFRSAGKTLHLLEVNPFGYAAGLSEAIPQGVLAVALQDEVTVSSVAAGKVISFRTRPVGHEDDAARLAAFMHREYLALAGRQEGRVPFYIIGERAADDLCKALKEKGLEVRLPALQIDGKEVCAAMLPAAALALRSALPARPRRFNFLKGDLAPKSEWAGIRRQFIGAACMLCLAAVLAITGAYLNYSSKQQQAESLRQQTTAIFRQTFPEVTTIVDPAMQMRAKLEELQQRARQLGLGQNKSGLEVLREISTLIPTETLIEVRELIYSGDEILLDGTAASFETINRLAHVLEESPLFEQSRITDANMSLDNSRVDFRLQMKIIPKDL